MSTTKVQNLPKFFLLFFSLLAAVGPFALDAYLPAMPLMANIFSVDMVAMNNTVPTYLVGYGLGQMLGGSISDKIGRKTVALTGLVLFMVATLLIIFATTIEQIQGFRALQALGGGFSTVICMAVMRDVFPAHEVGRKFAIVMMIVMIAPIISPTIGSFLMDISWQSIFIFLFCYALMTALIYFFFIPETRFSEDKTVSFGLILNQFKRTILKKSEGKIIPIRYCLTTTFASAAVMIFLTNASFAYIDYFGGSPKQFSLFFGANVVMIGIFLMVSLQLMKTIHPHKLMLVGAVLQLITMLILVTIVYTKNDTLWTVVPCLALGIGLMGLINPNGSAVFISFYDELSGSATSLNATLTFVIGAMLGGLTSLFFDGTLLPMAVMMLVGTVLCNLVAWSIPMPTTPFKKE